MKPVRRAATSKENHHQLFLIPKIITAVQVKAFACPQGAIRVTFCMPSYSPSPSVLNKVAADAPQSERPTIVPVPQIIGSYFNTSLHTPTLQQFLPTIKHKTYLGESPTDNLPPITTALFIVHAISKTTARSLTHPLLYARRDLSSQHPVRVSTSCSVFSHSLHRLI